MSNPIFTDTKAVNDHLDWSFNYADSDGSTNTGSATDDGFLQGDTISTSTWLFEGPDTALVLGTTGNTTLAASVIVSGGTEGYAYRVKNLVVTAGGDRKERTLHLEIVNN